MFRAVMARPGARASKLSSNESPLGASPAAIEAARNQMDHLEIYPGWRLPCLARGDCRGARAEPRQHSLLQRFGRVCSVCSPTPISRQATRRSSPSTVSLSTGSRPLAAGRQAGRRQGRRILHADVDAILAGGDRIARASSSLPIRTIPPVPICRSARSVGLQAGLPANVLLVIDAAYAEYVRRNDYEIAASNSCRSRRTSS